MNTNIDILHEHAKTQVVKKNKKTELFSITFLSDMKLDSEWNTHIFTKIVFPKRTGDF